MLEILDWDTSFFKKKIADLKEVSISKDNLYFIDKEAQNKGIEIIQSCVDIANVQSINSLLSKGFLFADLKVDYTTEIADRLKEINEIEKDYNNYNGKIEVATINDIEPLKKIATDTFLSSRYNNIISPQATKQLYSKWVENAVKGTFDDLCFKSITDNNISGFLTIKIIPKQFGKIGLIGISKHYQNKGIGSKLIRNLYSYLLNKESINTVKVTTQGENIMAQNFYIKNGLKIESIKAWYYKHVRIE